MHTEVRTVRNLRRALSKSIVRYGAGWLPDLEVQRNILQLTDELNSRPATLSAAARTPRPEEIWSQRRMRKCKLQIPFQ